MIVSFLICPNGNGHLFRTIDLIDFILKKKANLKINIFCSKKHHLKIHNYKFSSRKMSIFPIIPNYDLRKNTYSRLINLYNLRLSKKVIDETDIFISDNLINKYLPKTSTILHSNFFWSEVYSSKENLSKYKNIEKKFLTQNTCGIISNRYFGTCKQKVNFEKIKIGFTSKKNSKKTKLLTKYKEKKILVYFSGNDLCPDNLIDKLIQNGYRVYSDNISLLRNNKILKFNRKKNKMENFSYLITKPGLGSIKDSIKYKILPIFYFKKDNFEYVENFKKLAMIKKVFKNNHLNEEKIFKIVKNINFLTYKNILNELDKFKFDGDQIFWNFLKNYEKK